MMQKKYYALKASLPMLLFEADAPFTRMEFLENCRSMLDDAHFAYLKNLSLRSRELPEMEQETWKNSCPDLSAQQSFSAAQLYQKFEICLRNTLAERRAGKLSRELSGTVPLAEYIPEAARLASELFAAGGNPLEREKILDRARWDFLENLEWKHAFDFDGLCIYCLKLQILEKWHLRKNGDALKNLDNAASEAEKKSTTIIS